MKAENPMAFSDATASSDARHASTSTGAERSADRWDALFVLNSLAVGGSETKVIRLCNELHHRGTRIGVAYLNPPETLRSELNAAIPLFHLNRKGKVSLGALSALQELVREHRPRTLIAVSLYPTLYVNAAARLCAMRPRTAALINTSSFNPGQEWRRTLYTRLLHGLDWVVYGCEAQRELWQPAQNARTARNSSVIYNGVDTRRFSIDAAMPGEVCRRRMAIADDAFVIGSVGRLAPEKNQAVLIDVLEAIRLVNPRAHLLLVGDGPMRAELQARCDAKQLRPYVTFAGHQAHVYPWLALMDVFVLPSLYVETFSNAALEAMAMRRPVILSNIAGAAEMIREGVDGFLVEPRELSRRLPHLVERLARDSVLRSSLGRNARMRVELNFSFERMVDHYGDLIERLAADERD
jgi:glycosyltransferase involved in cell wall biosynthesis